MKVKMRLRLLNPTKWRNKNERRITGTDGSGTDDRGV